jgi:hypothetical protein
MKTSLSTANSSSISRPMSQPPFPDEHQKPQGNPPLKRLQRQKLVTGNGLSLCDLRTECLRRARLWLFLLPEELRLRLRRPSMGRLHVLAQARAHLKTSREDCHLAGNGEWTTLDEHTT